MIIVPFDNILARFQRVPGRQEDVHEFFTACMVNLESELRSLNPKTSGGSVHSAGSAAGEWQEIGSKNKKQTLVKPIGEEKEGPTLLDEVFGGRMRFVLLKQTVSAGSVSFQNFFSLHLDISSDKISTVEQALEAHMSRASVEGFHLGSREVKASMQMQFDTLPQVLVLQLKRFDFHRGAFKLTKSVTFPRELTLPARYIFASQLWRNMSRTYRLRAVIVHHGNNLTDGHYTSYCNYGGGNSSNNNNSNNNNSKSSKSGSSNNNNSDSNSGGSSGWIHCDDSKITPVSLSQVGSQQAYLLFYENVTSPSSS